MSHTLLCDFSTDNISIVETTVTDAAADVAGLERGGRMIIRLKVDMQSCMSAFASRARAQGGEGGGRVCVCVCVCVYAIACVRARVVGLLVCNL